MYTYVRVTRTQAHVRPTACLFRKHISIKSYDLVAAVMMLTPPPRSLNRRHQCLFVFKVKTSPLLYLAIAHPSLFLTEHGAGSVFTN